MERLALETGPERVVTGARGGKFGARTFFIGVALFVDVEEVSEPRIESGEGRTVHVAWASEDGLVFERRHPAYAFPAVKGTGPDIRPQDHEHEFVLGAVIAAEELHRHDGSVLHGVMCLFPLRRGSISHPSAGCEALGPGFSRRDGEFVLDGELSVFVGGSLEELVDKALVGRIEFEHVHVLSVNGFYHIF